jgi:hypothetical protein
MRREGEIYFLLKRNLDKQRKKNGKEMTERRENRKKKWKRKRKTNVVCL